MDAIDFETLDATIETERTQLANALRRIADRFDTLAVEDGGPCNAWPNWRSSRYS